MDLLQVFSRIYKSAPPAEIRNVKIGDWLQLSGLPIFCKECRGSQTFFVDREALDVYHGFLSFCPKCNLATTPLQLPTNEARFVADFWHLGINKFEALAVADNQVNSTSPNFDTKPTDDSSDVFASNLNDYLAENLKIVCWLKFSEAQAIVETYRKSRSHKVKSNIGNVLAKAVWHEDESPEQIYYKTKANVLLVRNRVSGEKAIGWVYYSEALAVLEIKDDPQSFEFHDEETGKVVGAFVYFDSQSPEFKKYKSNVCVLRKRGYKYPSYAELE